MRESATGDPQRAPHVDPERLGRPAPSSGRAGERILGHDRSTRPVVHQESGHLAQPAKLSPLTREVSLWTGMTPDAAARAGHSARNEIASTARGAGVP
jgi:hypothetical protein